jgi:hypothetical protein
MSRIFLIFMLVVTTISISGCSQTTKVETALPADVAAVTQPFLDAVRRGDQRAAEKYVAPEFIDQSGTQFQSMSAILKKAPILPPSVSQPGTDGPRVIFAAKDSKMWVSSELQLGRINGKYAILYWDVKRTPKPPVMLAHAQVMRGFVRNGFMFLAIFALAALAVLIWIVRNRTHLVAPEPELETRRVAATVRNTGPDAN